MSQPHMNDKFIRVGDQVIRIPYALTRNTTSLRARQEMNGSQKLLSREEAERAEFPKEEIEAYFGTRR